MDTNKKRGGGPPAPSTTRPAPSPDDAEDNANAFTQSPYPLLIVFGLMLVLLIAWAKLAG